MKTGNSRSEQPAPTMQPDMMSQQGMEADPMMDDQMPPMDDNKGSEFDTHFDAGVEADEDEDPKKYIQQLTGKLSQELNTYNNENDDEELSKYVGKMIVKAAAKGMDEKGRKDLIKSINTVDTATDDDNDEEPKAEKPEEEGETEMEEPQEMPMNEACVKKGDVKKMVETFSSPMTNDYAEKEDNIVKKASKGKKKTPFSGKKFN